MDSIEKRGETLYYLNHAIQIANECEIRFKNRTGLAKFCVEFINAHTARQKRLSVSTLTRSAVYRPLLEQFISSTSPTDNHLLLLELKIELSNIKEENKRLKLHLETLENPEQHIETSLNSKQALLSPSFNSGGYIKIIDVLLEHFHDHVHADMHSEEFICPYAISASKRTIVPRRIAKSYFSFKRDF